MNEIDPPKWSKSELLIASVLGLLAPIAVFAPFFLLGTAHTLGAAF